MVRVGYFEGTNPLLLSTLAAEGVETLPIANMMDGHGKNINQLSKSEVNVVVGPLHKVMPAETVRTALLPFIVNKMFSACEMHHIPVLLIVPRILSDKVKEMLSYTKANITVVAPEELETQIRRHLSNIMEERAISVPV